MSDPIQIRFSRDGEGFPERKTPILVTIFRDPVPQSPPPVTIVTRERVPDARGPKGDKGDQGDFGTALTADTQENLPVSGQFIGQFCRVGVVAPHVWYRWSGSEWERLVARSELPFFGTMEELKTALKEYFDDLYWNIPQIPDNAYLTPSGDGGYYLLEGEYYTQPS